METRTADRIAEDPTLGALLRSVAYHRLPTQFYQMLQLAIPFAAQLWHPLSRKMRHENDWTDRRHELGVVD